MKQPDLLRLILFQWLDDFRKRFRPIQYPLIVGMNGPQGCGKSTVSKALVDSFKQVGVKVITLSIDDFYLTRQSQIELSQRHHSNPYLQARGYPGTHDIELGRRTLEALKKIQDTGTVTCPVYDKSRFQGRGDRLPETSWKRVSAPLDLILLEGWMLGFTAVPEESINDDALKQVNGLLRNYNVWNSILDGFIQLSPSETNYVLDWRVEAEEKMKMAGNPGMSYEEVQAYIKTFLPAYEMYLPHLLKHPPPLELENQLRVVLSKDRAPISDLPLPSG